MTNYKNIYYNQELKKLEDDYKNGFLGFSTYTAKVFELGIDYAKDTDQSDLEYDLVKAVDMIAKQIDNASSDEEKFTHFGTILLLLAEGIQSLKK